MKQEVVMGLITQLVDLPLDSTKLKVSTANTEVKTYPQLTQKKLKPWERPCPQIVTFKSIANPSSQIYFFQDT